MVYPIGRLVIPAIMKIWLKKVEGTDNIPKNKAFIVCPNHSSFYDDLLIPSIIVPRVNRVLHMYVNRKFFRPFLLRRFLYWGGSIPVEVYDHPKKKDVNKNAFKKAVYYLKKGDSVGVYPEGHRTLDGELQRAKVGAARLALTAKVPVLPVGIIGSRDVLPKGQSLPRIRKIVRVIIGKPLYFDKYYGKQGDRKVLNNVTRKIMREIGKLIGKRYKY